MFDVAKPLDAPMSPILFGHTPMANQYDYNPDKAKALLKEAGFDFNREVKMITPTGRYTYDKQVAEAVQAYLQDIGVKVQLRTYDWPTYIGMTSKPLDQTELELYLIGWGAPYLDADFALFMYFSSFVQPPRGLGACFYSNPEFDKATGAARQILDKGKRRELYKQAATMLWEDAAAIWLHGEPYSIAYRSDLKGLTVLPLERMYPTYVTRK
jgi:peptide/nickel transport system substrate-binding protein